MTIFKRLAAGLIGAALLSALFSACAVGDPANGSAPVEETSKGSYIETDITPPDGAGTPMGLWTHSDGSIDYLATGQTGYALFHSTDSGTTWQKVDISSQNKVEGNIASLDMTDAGDFYAVSLTETSMAVWKISKGGEVSQIAIDEIDKAAGESGRVFPRALQALGEDRFFLWFTAYSDSMTGETSSGNTSSTEDDSASSESDSSNMNTSDMYTDYAAIYTDQGKMVKTIDIDMINKACANGSTLFLTDFNGLLQAFDGTTGNLLPDYTNQLKTEQFTYDPDADESGNFYYASTDGIARVVPGGSLAETIIDGSSYSFGSPACSISYFECAQDGSFLVGLILSSGSGKLYRYYYDENASSVPTQELSVWSLTESPSVRAAIIPFQQRNQNTRVNYEVGLGGEETAANVQDVARTLNTELLAGKGPDVLIMDGLDYQSYVEKGILADLNGSVSTDGLFETLIAPFETDGKRYLIPVRFTLPLIFGEKAAVDKLQNLADIASAVERGADRLIFKPDSADLTNPVPEEERPAFCFMELQDLFDALYSVSAPAIADRNAGINKDALGEFLGTMKRVSDKYRMTEPVEGVVGGGYWGITGSGTSRAPISVPKGLSDFVVGQAQYGFFDFYEMALVRFVTSKTDPDAAIFPGLCQGVYHPVELAGVNAGSELREQAAAFVQLMLEPDVQNFQVGDGLPVLESALDQMIEVYNRDSQGGTYNSKTFPLDLKGMIAQVKTPVNPDKVISAIIYAAAESYCREEKTLDETLQAVLSETEMYFAEKQ